MKKLVVISGLDHRCRQVKSFGGGIMQSLFKSLSFFDISITANS